MKTARILREKLKSQPQVTGLLYTFAVSGELVEAAIAAGCDYVIMDGEHLEHDPTHLAEIFRLCRLAEFPALYRPPHTDAGTIRTAMDLGACGFLLPQVESVEHLDQIRQGLYMPPRGRRRPGGPANRWLTQYDYATFRSVVEDHFIVVPQIESRQGLENAEAIAADALVTAMGIGPFDLSAELGCCFDLDHPDLVAAWNRVAAAGAAAGKPMWAIGAPARLRERGVTFMCIGEVVEMLRGAMRQAVGEARAAP